MDEPTEVTVKHVKSGTVFNGKLYNAEMDLVAAATGEFSGMLELVIEELDCTMVLSQPHWQIVLKSN